MRRLVTATTCLVVAGTLLGGCGPSTKLPPLPPAADLCIYYASYRYSPAAAAVEAIEALQKHAGNEDAFYNKCISGKQSQNPGGAR